METANNSLRSTAKVKVILKSAVLISKMHSSRVTQYFVFVVRLKSSHIKVTLEIACDDKHENQYKWETLAVRLFHLVFSIARRLFKILINYCKFLYTDYSITSFLLIF